MNSPRRWSSSCLPSPLPLLAALGLLVAAPGCEAQQEDPDRAVPEGGELPAGWMARMDRAEGSLEDVRLRTRTGGWRITLGPAAIFWRPGDRATRPYRVRATFTQLESPRHAEAYGVLVGGRDLAGEEQEYLYFLVRQDGKFLVKRRSGAETHTLVPWSGDPAVRSAGRNGRSTNALAIEASGEEVRFIANGEVVARLQRAPALPTDGIVGIRVNHNLDVAVTGFGIEDAY